MKKTDTAKSRLEKRNSELMGQVDTHRRRLDEKEDECHNLGNQLQSRETLMKKCIEEKVIEHVHYVLIIMYKPKLAV